jgi:hypothetical protein
MYFSTMQTGIHTAPIQVTVPSVREGRVEHAVSHLYLLILLISLAFTLIIVS